MNIIQSVLCVEVKFTSKSPYIHRRLVKSHDDSDTLGFIQTLLNEYVWKEICLFRPEMCLLLEEEKNPPLLHTLCGLGDINQKDEKNILKKGIGTFLHFKFAAFKSPSVCYFCLTWRWKTEERRTRWVKWQTGGLEFTQPGNPSLPEIWK